MSYLFIENRPVQRPASTFSARSPLRRVCVGGGGLLASFSSSCLVPSPPTFPAHHSFRPLMLIFQALLRRSRPSIPAARRASSS